VNVSTQNKPDGAAEQAAEFDRLGPRDNFYQSCAYVPMSFALVTTVDERGETGIGPHALCFPFNVTEPYAMLLISRPTSATAANIRRTRRCALNYIEFDEERLRSVARLGYPGQTPDDKRRASTFTLGPSPVAASRADANFPALVLESFQVLECTWDDSMDLAMPGPETVAGEAGKFVLRVDNILLKQRFRDGVERGRNFPSMPIFMGFRAGGEFWFARHLPPFPIEAPKVAGTELNSVMYLANRLDERLRFTADACAALTAIPRPFLQPALEAIIAAARERGLERIDRDFIDAYRRDRPGG
jgi:flavin reductase (DIM6/NTAB) family NADH-FMN oxidoreductase RutF